MNTLPEDIDEILRAHWREVYGLLLVITRNAATAEDLTQEVFLLAHRKSIEDGPRVRFWLRETARLLALNELRRRRPQPYEPLELQRLLESNLEISTLAPDSTFDEQLGALRLCMKELPAADQDILRARYERSESLGDIAARIKQSVGYMKQRFFRLRKRLAECVTRRLAMTGVSHVQSGI